MKKSIHIFIFISVLFILGNLIIRPVSAPPITIEEVPEIATSTPQFVTYRQSNMGIEFKYKTGTDGYVLDERMPVDLGEEMIKTIILTPTTNMGQETPVGGEMPPVISISIFLNEQNLKAELWANENSEDSGIKRASSPVEVVAIGGTNAIQYISDGLYATDTYIVNHQGFIYVIRGEFIESKSLIQKDFDSLIDSINFFEIAKSDEEYEEVVDN